MKNMKKQRKRYNKGTRQDYTAGGRVGYQEGGKSEREIARDAEKEYQESLKNNPLPLPELTPPPGTPADTLPADTLPPDTPAETTAPTQTTTGQPVVKAGTNKINVEAPASVSPPPYTPPPEYADSELDETGNFYLDPETQRYNPTAVYIASQKDLGFTYDYEKQAFVQPDVGFNNTTGLTPEQKLARERRLNEADESLKAAKAGTLPIPQITDPTLMEYDKDTEIKQMEKLGDVPTTTVSPIDSEIVTGAVAKDDISTADDIAASTFTGDQITEAPVIDAQTGEVSANAIAEMQTQALTKYAEGVTINDETASKALAQVVKGTISAEAKAKAAEVAGTTLPRVLRAKKQLRKAGLTEDQITELGNDPESLEAQLMGYTEEQRGMIEGLPEEALVSTQINALLEGMESGEIPNFAKPAVAAVNEMLAARGLTASTVGRDSLFNAIIQSAMPIAQSNAQSIKESVMQQKGIEAQAELQNAQMRQQTALTNADKVFNMDMANLANEQQTVLSNSKFLQTVTLTNSSNEQQATMQNAAVLAQLDLATLDSNTKLTAQNAQAFLGMDMTNLNNEQQVELLKGQQAQQTLLSNQAATNASLQFNAASQNQVNQFMATVGQQTKQFNTSQANSMEQFNAAQKNAAAARKTASDLDIAKTDAALASSINQFNAKQNFAREQFNTQAAQIIIQSDTKYRRDLNTANTAAINAVNQQNAQNAFGLSSQAQAFMWQEMRDQADFAFKAYDNNQQRIANMYVEMLGNESVNYEGGNWEDNLSSVSDLIGQFLDD